MTRGQKIYFAVVCCFAVFLLMGVAVMTLVMIPKQTGDPHILRFTALVMGVISMSLIATSALMLKKKSLLLIPTCIQCILLLFTVYGVPIAIAGFLLLRAKGRRERDEVDKVEAILCPVCKTLPDENAIQFGDVRVCSGCKAQFEQRLREGV